MGRTHAPWYVDNRQDDVLHNFQCYEHEDTAGWVLDTLQTTAQYSAANRPYQKPSFGSSDLL